MANTNLNKEGKKLNNPLLIKHFGVYHFGAMTEQSHPILIDFSHPAFCFMAAMRHLQGAYQNCKANGVPATFEAVARRVWFYFYVKHEAEYLAHMTGSDLYKVIPDPFDAESIPYYANLLTAMLPTAPNVAMVKACIRGISVAIRGTNDIHYKE